MLVDVGIVARPRIELLREGDLGVVFRQMRLHVQVGELAHQRLAISICSGVEVMAKRGVIA